MVLSGTNEKALQDWIRDHNMLFNKKNSDYKDTVKK